MLYLSNQMYCVKALTFFTPKPGNRATVDGCDMQSVAICEQYANTRQPPAYNTAYMHTPADNT